MSSLSILVTDFSFPGIEFRTQKFDDGKLATCFTWEVVIMDNPQTTKGISFYELDPDTRLITYVRDVPEPAIKVGYSIVLIVYLTLQFNLSLYTYTNLNRCHCLLLSMKLLNPINCYR